MIKAIETVYKGYRFRSRLEARWAVFFDTLGVKWEYEKEGYEFEDGTRYLPDFWLPEHKRFIEIKPDMNITPIRIYLAGKISPDWRSELKLGNCQNIGPDICLKHTPGLHRSYETSSHRVVETCLHYIREECNALFAWINSIDCYATLVEIGYAKAQGVDVWVGIDNKLISHLCVDSDYYDLGLSHDQISHLHEMWFIEEMAHKFGWFNSPQQALDMLALPPCPEVKKCLELSKRYDIDLVQGEPYSDKFSVLRYRQGHVLDNRVFFIGLRIGLTPESPEVKKAYEAARSARFEFGENSHRQTTSEALRKAFG